jgi:hypothetical protein
MLTYGAFLNAHGEPVFVVAIGFLRFSLLDAAEVSAESLHHTPPSTHRATVPLIRDTSADDTSQALVIGEHKRQERDDGAGPCGKHLAEVHSELGLPLINRIPIELLGYNASDLRAYSPYVSVRRGFHPIHLPSVSFKSPYHKPCLRLLVDVSLSTAKLWLTIAVRSPCVSMIPIIRLWLLVHCLYSCRAMM